MASNPEILARFIDECWNARNKSIGSQLLAPDYEHYMPGVDQPTVGPAAYQQLVDSFIAGFPDIHFDIDDVFGEGERVCLMWTASGTHKGVFSGLPPTDNFVTIHGVAVARIVEGKIKKIVSMFDNASFTNQLNAPPEKAAESWRATARSAG
ncbi:ester cyclase [Paludibaculum fermentans]|uniref:ester cyclase n=1 Tax=Paludibaculum fermentans TaxID=1473598 RepID=UPI003EC0E357